MRNLNFYVSFITDITSRIYLNKFMIFKPIPVIKPFLLIGNQLNFEVQSLILIARDRTPLKLNYCFCNAEYKSSVNQLKRMLLIICRV